MLNDRSKNIESDLTKNVLKNFITETRRNLCLSLNWTPLFKDPKFLSIYEFKPEELETLIDNDANFDVNKPLDEQGTCLIHIAVATRSTLCLAILLKRGADLQKTCTGGETALSIAIKHYYFEAILLILNQKEFKITHTELTLVSDYLKKKTIRLGQLKFHKK